MNQNTNLIQWKNLTDEQKADFNFEGYKYEFQMFDWVPKQGSNIANDRVYRLVIEEDKWYFCKGVYKKPILGKYLICENNKYERLKVFENLRPAKLHEIPKPKEKSLQERIQEKWPDKEVVMLFWEEGALRVKRPIERETYNLYHCTAQSMKGFFRYVYEYGDGELYLFHEPLDVSDDKTIQPVAALFKANK